MTDTEPYNHGATGGYRDTTNQRFRATADSGVSAGGAVVLLLVRADDSPAPRWLMADVDRQLCADVQTNGFTADLRRSSRTGGGVLPSQQKLLRGNFLFWSFPFPISARYRVIRRFPRKALPDSRPQAGSGRAAPNSGTRKLRKRAKTRGPVAA